ncbi:undecaprenyl-phosphate 4-deoxy-4-formamido-L-arabinose transferase [Thorsellia anophelis]|uniref:Undecaprenyl-phosphate 4-deoxy-4-formamido-L-arabinose transferase n=1 Tax=Thorsellia anophelis DSM 18579 TaxID=1123402 RepID=A0A1I0BNU5_9GAMM|nr:undecaprenyl-phosphate 4-deoxy-4-formamido-L-arabinose transferase [Thorsellia anophelis]SET08352.1 undecaprenyl-phosphate 4-deoxy-4-formamido-L-arabinose transferase [Thorsellia anophelis DSM 18579]
MFLNKPIEMISLVIPIFNEKENIPILFERVFNASLATSKSFEIILVDDGSTDGSSELIAQLAELSKNHVIGVFLNRNYGQHSAIMAGFVQAKGDLIITLDGDLQNPPEEIPNIVNHAEEGYDVIGTIRENRQDSWFRKAASMKINSLIQTITGKPMGDYGCMLRGYRKHIVEAMLLCHERSTFIPILANSFARKTIDIPVKHEQRLHGKSKYSVFKLIHLMFDLVTCLTTTPLRLLSLIGCLIASLGFIFAITLLSLRLFLGPQWAASGVFTLFAVLFIFIGAQFIALGILGEYIGRIYNDVRARPRYFILHVIDKIKS